MSAALHPGERAEATGGWVRAHRFLVARRMTQFGFLALFLCGPWLGLWITKGTLASSLTLGVLPLTDPFIVVQELVAGHVPEMTVFTGAAIVLAAYLLVGGRSYCAWVCPINPVTDLAAWLRRHLDIKKGWSPKPQLRLYMMIAVLAVTAVTGMLAWELVNPITALHRALVFGTGFGFAAAGVIFAFDLFTARHGWCGHLCPVGAFYGTIGEMALLRVAAPRRAACDDCMDCYEVCPEPQVIAPALRGDRTGDSPVILAGACLNCGRCIDVCSLDVFAFTHRFDNRDEDASAHGPAGLTASQGGRQ